MSESSELAESESGIVIKFGILKYYYKSDNINVRVSVLINNSLMVIDG